MTWDDIVEFLLRFPNTELTTTWNMPAVKADGVLVAWLRDLPDSPGSVAFKTPADEREALLAADTPFYTIEHFEKFGTRAVLVEPERVARDEWEELLTDAWLSVAKKRSINAWDTQEAGD